MISRAASATSPAPTQPSAAVAATQPMVARTRPGFLRPATSARAPSAGMVNMTSRFETASAAVQASVPQLAPAATTLTK